MSGSLEIVSSQGAARRYPLTERVILGGSAPASVVVDDEPGLLAEHVMFAPQGRSCWVSVVDGARVPVTLEGRAFTSGHVPWGSELRLGGTTLRLLAAESATDVISSAGPGGPDGPGSPGGGGAEPAAAASAERTSPVLLIALVMAVGWVGWTFLEDDAGGARRAPSAEAPALFGSAECPDTDKALFRGQILAEEGAAKAERYPFAPRDGVRAVELFARSEACLREAGQTAAAEQVAAEATTIRDQINRDFATQRFTLERALDGDDLAAAERAANILAQLVAHLPDTDYATQLNGLRRRIARARRASFED